MESLVPHGDCWTLGGYDEGRVPAARQRLLVGHFYIPLAELVEIGREAFQHDRRLPMIYSQSSGLAFFFMHAGDGKYRQPWVEYLKAIYANKVDPDTLSRLTHKKYDKLDEEYSDFMKQGGN